MSLLGAALYHRLANNAGVTALVSTRIYPARAPQDATGDRIVYQIISGESDHHMTAASGTARVRMQIDCIGSTYLAANTLARTVRESIDGYRGTWGTGVTAVVIQMCHHAGQRDDITPIIDESDASEHQVTMDFEIWHNEPVPVFA